MSRADLRFRIGCGPKGEDLEEYDDERSLLTYYRSYESVTSSSPTPPITLPPDTFKTQPKVLSLNHHTHNATDAHTTHGEDVGVLLFALHGVKKNAIPVCILFIFSNHLIDLLTIQGSYHPVPVLSCGARVLLLCPDHRHLQPDRGSQVTIWLLILGHLDDGVWGPDTVASCIVAGLSQRP